MMTQRHPNLAACYQLAKYILKIGSVLAERAEQGEVGGCVEKPWSTPGGPFLHNRL